MGLGIESRIVIIRNPYVFPFSKDLSEEIEKLSKTNKLVILLQSGAASYPVSEDCLPSNVYLIRYSFYEGEEELLESAKEKIQQIFSEVGAEIQYDILPILFSGACLKLPEEVELCVFETPEKYQNSSATKIVLTKTDVEAAKWVL